MSKLVVNTYNKKSRIDKNIYGNFSEHLGRCIYNGVYVGEDSPIPNDKGMRRDVVAALRDMKLPVLRWPGGCFADEYHWRDGIGPKESRKKMINTHWGGVTEDNSFGTHEFLELCRQIGCEPYITANLGSGTVQEMSEWIEYMNFGGVSPMAALREQNGQKEPWCVKYIGIGNENWGCGGSMTAEYYANEYRRYQTYCRNYPGAPLFKIACGPSGGDYRWTEVLMREAGRMMNGLALHHYTVPGDWGHKGSATVFDEKEWYVTLMKTLEMDRLIKGHSAIMDRYDPRKRVSLVVDEWGTWYDVEPGTNPGFLYQQNTMRDALVAGINLNIFNKHSDRVRMTNIAQLINVLQAVILTDGEKMLLTPTYHVFKMYAPHQDATLLDSFIQQEYIGVEEDVKVPDLHESVSEDAKGNITITVCNLSCTDSKDVDTILVGAKASSVDAEILTNKMDAFNTFESPENVKPTPFDGVKITEEGLSFTLPACSVSRITVKK
ncbi:MAG: alpha-N-arabinofuranosidase [Eubacteriales bacterium]|jgi:alpha-N-arabinofuranosidase|nr:alpha-N-arabinofuranosidase [Clostridiales bacterium]